MEISIREKYPLCRSSARTSIVSAYAIDPALVSFLLHQLQRERDRERESLSLSPPLSPALKFKYWLLTLLLPLVRSLENERARFQGERIRTPNSLFFASQHFIRVFFIHSKSKHAIFHFYATYFFPYVGAETSPKYVKNAVI